MDLTEVESAVLTIMVGASPPWFFRAIDPSTPTLDGKTIFSQTYEYNDHNILVPTIRMKNGKLKNYDNEALDEAILNGDFVILPSDVDPDDFSNTLSTVIDKFRKRPIDGG